MFKANPGDTACPEQFYFWADRYTNGGGYQTSCSADIEAPAWTPKTPRFTNTGTVRHGTVTPLTLREWNRILGQPNADVATTTELSLASADRAGGRGLHRHGEGARGGRLRGRRPGPLLRPRAGRRPSTSTAESPRSPCPAASAPGCRSITAEYLGPRVPHGLGGHAARSWSPRSWRSPSAARCRPRLALTLGAPASFGPFTPGVEREYTASTTATVTSTHERRGAERVGGDA